MSEYHEIKLKPIYKIAEYKKNLIPANIPKTYPLKPIFKNIAIEDDI